ncbi:MAG: hypothetical protein EBR82_49475 [Caulobacteraceae bacterium]|nr:hypothetical protein [Caulobacteraceae bacterium]
MPGTPLREAALAAIATRLQAQLPDVVVERARRAPVDVDAETLPRLILRGEDWQADDTEEPGRTHYELSFSVAGFASAATDLAAEQALSLLHARVVETLAGWTPSTAGLGDVAEQSAEFSLYDAEDAARPAGEFLARFSMLAIGPNGGPWAG